MAGSGSFTCDNCGKPKRGTPTRSMTGRVLCQDCADTLTGLAAGVLASEGDVGSSVATAGWYKRLRDRRKKPEERG